MIHVDQERGQASLHIHCCASHALLQRTVVIGAEIITNHETFMKRHCIVVRIEDFDLDLCVYIEAKELKVVSHERVIADGVIIDLPGDIQSL